MAKGYQGARWKAGDVNGDTVHYTVEIRGKSETTWKTLKKDLAIRQFSWDSSAFPDGEYVLRISATDAPSSGESREHANPDQAPARIALASRAPPSPWPLSQRALLLPSTRGLLVRVPP